MPAPTVTSVAPTSGLTGGGSLVTITGTNFETNIAFPVTVAFGGIAATAVRVVAATTITCLPPAAPIADDANSLVVAVAVTNTGGPNAGTGTLASAYTYRRPDLTVRSHLTETIVSLLRRMKQQLLRNVAWLTSVDYDLSTADLLNRVEFAKLPIALLVGPVLAPFRIVPRNEQTLTFAGAGPDTYERHERPHPTDLLFEVRLISASKEEITNLLQQCVGFLQRNRLLSVNRDPLNSGAGVVTYPLLLAEEFRYEARGSRANVLEVVASWRVEGVLLENGDLVEAAPTIDTTPLTTEQIP